MFQIGVAADVFGSPVGKLACEHQAEAVAKGHITDFRRNSTPLTAARSAICIFSPCVFEAAPVTSEMRSRRCSLTETIRRTRLRLVSQACRTRRPFHSERSQFWPTSGSGSSPGSSKAGCAAPAMKRSTTLRSPGSDCTSCHCVRNSGGRQYLYQKEEVGTRRTGYLTVTSRGRITLLPALHI